MSDKINRVQMLRDLRFALEVMEERSHVGLDDESARIIKNALLRQIGKSEEGLGPVSVSRQLANAEEFLIA
jgi:hypothetical protein